MSTEHPEAEQGRKTTAIELGHIFDGGSKFVSS